MAKKRKNTRRPKSALAGLVLSVFTDNPFRAYNYKQVGNLLGIKDKASRDLLMTILKELTLAGELDEVKVGKYILNQEKLHEITKTNKHIIGTVDLKSTGKAYITPDDGGEDIYIAANNVNHALNEDLVKVFVFPKRKGHKIEGQVVEVLERTKDTYVGILETGKNFGFVIPDNVSMPYDIFVPKSQIGEGQNGQKVLVKITEWPEHYRSGYIGE